ncbi:glycosyltransferase family 4 protein [Blastococcus sp. SYSU D00813]
MIRRRVVAGVPVERRRRTRREVLITGLNFFPEQTGIAPYTTGLARHLAGSDIAVTVVTGHPHYPEWRLHPGYETPRPVETDEGVEVVRVKHPVPGNPTGLSRIVMEAVFALRSGRELWRRRSDVALVVSPALLSALPAVAMKPFRRHAVGVVVQDLYGAAVSEAGLGGSVLSRATAWLEKQVMRRADGVAVIHPIFRDRLVAMGVPAERIRVIPNWSHVTIPDINREEVRRELGWEPDAVIALHAGNMGVKQGLGTLVEVARRAEETGSDVRVVLLGDGSQRTKLQAEANGLESLQFLEPLPAGDFERALAAADCLLLNEKPGVVEMSVPSKLTTYFSAGKPVVAATDTASGAAQLVRDSGAGVIVRSGDADSILAAVTDLAQDPQRGEGMGRNGRRYAAQRLAGDTSLSLYDAWLGDLLRHARPRRRRDDD